MWPTLRVTRAILAGLIVLAAILFAGIAWIAPLFGLTGLTITSGSMAPTVPNGALVLGKDTATSDVLLGQLVTVPDRPHQVSRCVQIDSDGEATRLFLRDTTGQEDEHSGESVLVSATVWPHAGQVWQFFQRPAGIAVVSVLVLIALALFLIPLGRKDRKLSNIQRESDGRDPRITNEASVPAGQRSMTAQVRPTGVRSKVFGALIVPIAAITAVGAFLSYQALGQVNAAKHEQAMVELLPKERTAVQSVMAERSGFLATQFKQDTTDTASLRQQTDSAIETYTAAVDDADLSVLTGGADADIRDGLTRISDTLTDARKQSEANSPDANVVTSGYAQVAQDLTLLPQALATQLADRKLAANINAQVQVQNLADALALETPYITRGLALAATPAPEAPEEGTPDSAAQDGADVAATPATATGTLADSDLIQMTGLIKGTDDARRQASSAMNGLVGGAGTLPLFDQSFADTRVLVSASAFDGIDAAALSQRWPTMAASEVSTLNSTGGKLQTAAASQAADGVTDAQSTLLTIVLIALGVILISIVVAIVVGVKLTRAVRRAGDLVRAMPAPIAQLPPGPAAGQTIDQRASAQGEAEPEPSGPPAGSADVATAASMPDTSEAFANLARRDQALLNRQLAVLDELERSEEDPVVLTNLFALDNLATRMRRNSESLLVLAGVESGRRMREPMQLSDVIRTGASQIEQYDRVRMDVQVDPNMLGHNVLSAAHLLAELLENATLYSEPNSPVEVSSSSDSETVTVTIVDSGLGMSEEDLASANARVSSPDAAGPANLSQLGLHVVGRLASKLGTSVSLAKASDGTGTLTTIGFPQTLFAGQSAPGHLAEAPVPPLAGMEPVAGVESLAQPLAGSSEGQDALAATAQPSDGSELSEEVSATRRRTDLPLPSDEPTAVISGGPSAPQMPVGMEQFVGPIVPDIGLDLPETGAWVPQETATDGPGSLLPMRNTALTTPPPADVPTEEPAAAPGAMNPFVPTPLEVPVADEAPAGPEHVTEELPASAREPKAPPAMPTPFAPILGLPDAGPIGDQVGEPSGQEQASGAPIDPLSAPIEALTGPAPARAEPAADLPQPPAEPLQPPAEPPAAPSEALQPPPEPLQPPAEPLVAPSEALADPLYAPIERRPDPLSDPLPPMPISPFEPLGMPSGAGRGGPAGAGDTGRDGREQLDEGVAWMRAIRNEIESQAAAEEGDVYSPQAVDLQDGEGLHQRARSLPRVNTEPPPVTIERDPEELRARLSAFRTGTERGRREGSETTMPQPLVVDFDPIGTGFNAAANQEEE